MASIPVKPPRPVIDWSNPLTRGLCFDAAFFEGSGDAKDLIANRKGIKNGVVNWVKSNYGICLDFDSGNPRYDFTIDPDKYPNRAITVETLIYPYSAGENNNGRFFAPLNPSDGGRIICDIDASTNSFGYRMLQTSGAFPGWGSTNGSYAGANKWYHLTISYPEFGNNSAVPDFMINGVKKNSYAFSVAPTGAIHSAGPKQLIGNNASNIRDFDGIIMYVRFWNRVLVLRERTDLYANPWRIYKKPQNILSDVINSFFSFFISDSGVANDTLTNQASVDLSDASSAVDSIIQSADVNVPDNGGAFCISESMDAAPVGTLENSATYDSVNKWVRLTTAISNDKGYLRYNKTLPAGFDMSCRIYANGGADANFFYWGCTGNPPMEDSAMGGYIVAFDEYQNKIQLTFNGLTLQEVTFNNFGNATWRYATVIVRGNNIRVLINSTVYLNYTDTTRTFGGDYVGMGARTGGSTAEHRVDDFYITTDVVTTAVDVSISDTGVSSETLDVLAQVALSDSSLATEAIVILAAIAMSDSATASEALAVLNGLTITDSALSNEVMALLSYISVQDSGTGVENVITGAGYGLYTRASQLHDINAALQTLTNQLHDENI